MSYLERPLSPASILPSSTKLLTMLRPENLPKDSLEDSVRITFILLTILTGISVIFLIGSFLLSKAKFFRHMALPTVQAADQGYTAQTYSATLIGLQGTAQTPLRPAGKAMIQNVYYDARTLGTYVAPGTTVVVTSVEGTSLVVRPTRQL